MTAPLYYATTARNLKDVAQYGIYAGSKVVGRMLFNDPRKADFLAGAATTAFYASLTTGFSLQEFDAFDRVMRPAVCAELGIPENEFKPSDYGLSKNHIVQKYYGEQWKHTNNMRYATDLLPMLPVAVRSLSRKFPKFRALDDGLYDRNDLPEHASPLAHLMHGWGMYDNAVYAGKATYWAYETYGVDKSGFYALYKMLENIESTKKEYSENDLIEFVNRCRSDCDLPMLNEKSERRAIWPVLTYLKEKLNNSDHFNLQELAYLGGNGFFDVWKKDEQGREIKDEYGNLIVSRAELMRTKQEIDRIDKIGMDGIIEENCRARERMAQAAPHHQPHGVYETVADAWVNAQWAVYTALFPRKKTFVESISPRDPGETHSVVA